MYVPSWILVVEQCWCLQVPTAYVEKVDLVPDVDKGQLSILVHGNAAARGLKVSVFTFAIAAVPFVRSHSCCLE